MLVQQFSCCLQAENLEEPQQRAPRMNEPYGPEAPRPISSTSPGTMKMFMGFLTVFTIVQTIGTVLFCLYLHMKMDKVSRERSLSLSLMDCWHALTSDLVRSVHQEDEHGGRWC